MIPLVLALGFVSSVFLAVLPCFLDVSRVSEGKTYVHWEPVKRKHAFNKEPNSHLGKGLRRNRGPVVISRQMVCSPRIGPSEPAVLGFLECALFYSNP